MCNLPVYILKNINVYLYAESYDSTDPKETATDDQLVLDDTDSDGSQLVTSTDSSDDDIWQVYASYIRSSQLALFMLAVYERVDLLNYLHWPYCIGCQLSSHTIFTTYK